MFFSVYLLLLASIPYILELKEKELRYHFIFTIFFIFFLSIMSINGPDFTTYRKNYYSLGSFNWDINNDFNLFNFITYVFNKFSLSFFTFQLIIKLFFLFGFYLFIKKLYDYKFDYFFAIIFTSIYLIPIVTINNLFQATSIGLFLVLVSFKDFKLLRDLPLLIIIALTHRSSFAPLLIYCLNFFLQFRRFKLIKLLNYFLIILAVVFTLFFFLNFESIRNFVYERYYILNQDISFFHYIWILIFIIFSILFFISKKDLKKLVSYKDYNFLISSILFVIPLFFIYFLSKQYAFRLIYYEFVFILFMLSLLPKIKILKFHIFKKYYILNYIIGCLIFILIWYKFANERKSYIEYKFNTNINFFCKKNQNCNEKDFLDGL